MEIQMEIQGVVDCVKDVQEVKGFVNIVGWRITSNSATRYDPDAATMPPQPEAEEDQVPF